MKVAAKVQAKIPVHRFICGPGKVEAEGRKASPAFCYRIKVDGRKTVIELHSRVSGRKIGYIGRSAGHPFSPSRTGAGEWTQKDMPAHKPREIPIQVARKMQHFLKLAQDPAFEPKATLVYRDVTKKAWKEINREARKP